MGRSKIKQKKKMKEEELLRILSQQSNALKDVLSRTAVIEETVFHLVPELTTDIYYEKVSRVCDEFDGYVPVDTINPGDRIRAEVCFGREDKEKGNFNKIMFRFIGAGQILPVNIEEQLYDLSEGEEKEITYDLDKEGDDKGYVFVRINMISRRKDLVQLPVPVPEVVKDREQMPIKEEEEKALETALPPKEA